MRDYASLYSLLLSDLGQGCTGDLPVTSDMGIRNAAACSLASSFYKKLCPDGNTVEADRAALEKFRGINDSIGGSEWSFGASSEPESCFYDYFKDHLRSSLDLHESMDSFDLDYIREHMGVGPGAAQGADSSCMVAKLFEGEMTHTNRDLIPLYRGALIETGYWADAEMQRFQEYGFTEVRGSKLFFASKNAEISRVCCTEANLNMLVQKAVGAFLEYRLGKTFKIFLKTQPDHNREMARMGSLDGGLATMDLVSASDSIMLQLCRDALPDGKLKSVLLACRSRFAILPGGEEVELKMVSTMGNGFTFPLQTLIFACAVRAVYDLMGFPSSCPKTQFGVFGDDIIVRKEGYEFLRRMLEKLGFSVNVGKSFNTGPFRESCGHDYYAGVNIRGVYIRSLETPQEVYSAINRLTRWSTRHGIALSSTVRMLLSWVRDIRVPPSESDDAGLHVPFKATTPKLTPLYAFKYRAYKRKVKRKTVSEPDDLISPPININGVALGFLSGVYRRRDILLTNLEDSAWKHDVSISVPIRDRRGARPRYQIVPKSIFWWDYVDSKYQTDMDPAGGWAEWRDPLTRVSYDIWGDVMVELLGT